MRLSEKTIELNFCAQSSAIFNGKLIWFGLTQRQEARAGFDACTRLGGRLMIFQFKASSRDVNGARRFIAPHKQMQNLMNIARFFRNSVFYVFPLVGTTDELSRNNGDIISNSWLLDVTTIPPLAPPITRKGTPRKNGVHYIDVVPPRAIIHSEPVVVKLIHAAEFFSHGAPGVDGVQNLFKGENYDFEEFRRLLGKNVYGAILLPDIGWSLKQSGPRLPKARMPNSREPRRIFAGSGASGSQIAAGEKPGISQGLYKVKYHNVDMA